MQTCFCIMPVDIIACNIFDNDISLMSGPLNYMPDQSLPAREEYMYFHYDWFCPFSDNAQCVNLYGKNKTKTYSVMKIAYIRG